MDVLSLLPIICAEQHRWRKYVESAAITKTSASLQPSLPIRSTRVKRVYTIIKKKLAIVQDQIIFDEVIALHCLLMHRFVVTTS
jgi:hypothetical protein